MGTLRRVYLPLIFVCIVIIEATGNDTNETSTHEDRQGRVTGRIVKLYSGTRPEPILCAGEGFQKDPHNCAVFYRCTKSGHGKFTVFRFQCGPGTVYDPNTEVCNHPRSTRRAECGGILAPLVDTTHVNEVESMHHEVPSPLVTNRPLYATSSTAYPEIFASTHFTTKREAATTSINPYPWGLSISNVYIDDDKNNMLYPTMKPSTVLNTFTSSPQTIFTPSTTSNTPNSSSRDNICITDGFMGDTENCHKFYRCVANQGGGYTRFEFSCSESTVWDEDSQICNHIWAVKRSRCGRQNDINTNILVTNKPQIQEKERYKQDLVKNNSGHTIQQQLQISYGSKVTQTQTQISKGPVVQNQTQIHYGDKIKQDKNQVNKQNQTQISNGSAISQSQTQIDLGNKGVQTQLQIDHSKEASQTQTQISESTTKRQNQDNNKPSPDCTRAGFMGDGNDCRKFYRCVENGQGGYQKYEFSCSEGTVWDQNLETCNHAWAVKDCGSIGVAESSTAIVSTSSDKTTQNYYTTKSTSTENYQPVPDTNDYDEDNGYGNKIPAKPSKPSSSTTTTTSTSKPNLNTGKCTSSGFMGDDNDCKIFYRCVENGNGGFTKYEFKCGEGTVWDSEIEACNHAWAVKKCGGQGSIDSSTHNATVTATSTENYQPNPESVDEENYEDNGYENESPTPSSTTITTTSSPTNNGKCTSSGFIGDDNDCKIFYRCVDNGNEGFTKYEFKCGEGTVWDPEIEGCNHAWAVKKCGENVLPSNSDKTDTTNSPSPPPPINDEAGIGYPSNDDSDSTAPQTTQASTDSSKKPSETNFCVNSGFMGDNNNCKKFYRCVDDGKGGFTRYEFDCGEGTVWDQSIEACNHAWAVKECGGNAGSTTSHTASETTTQVMATTSYQETPVTNTEKESSVDCKNEGFMGDSNNCKTFYRCADDGKGGFVKYQFSCGDGTYWNQEILSCDHITSDRECGKSNGSSTTTAPQHDQPEDMSTKTTPKDESQVTQKPTKPTETTGICTSEGFYGDKNDCKKFYRCVDNGKGGYTKHDFVCGDGTIWDVEIQACNHDTDGKCSSASSGTEDTPESQMPQHGESTSTSTTTEKTDTSSSEPSSNQCISEGFSAVPNDCKRFIRCVDNGKGGFTKYEFACGDGTVWVQEILACDHDTGAVNCSSQPVNKPVTSEGYPQTTEKQESSSTTEQVGDKQDDEYDNNNNKPPSSSENNVCSSEGYFGNKDDCRKFYRCVDNGKGGLTKYDFTCAEGTAWDSNTQSCNHIDEVSSCRRPVMHDEDNTQTTQTSSQSSSSTTTTQKPTTTSEASNNSTSENGDTCESEGYFGNKQDCKKFYRCVDNGKGGYTKYDFTCADGTLWDQDLTTCNHESDVVNLSCNQTSSGSSTNEGSSGGSSSTEANASGSTSGESGASESSSSGSTSSSTEGGTSKKPGNDNVNCTKAGFYPNPNDCKKFYRCVDWDGDGTKFSVFHFECGEGTIWDPAVETCNHENSVYPPRDCSAQSQAAGESGETTTESTTESTIQSTTESTTQSTTESTTQSTTESTTQSTTESTTQSTTESTTQSTTESTTESTTQSTTESTTQSTTEPTTQSTTESTTESTTQSTTESTTQSTTESTTQSTTESTTQSTTESTTQSTTESTTQSTTESTTESTTQSSTESTTQSTTESTTQSTTEESTTSGTTEQSGETTTQQSGDNTTEQTEGTTQQSAENTTANESGTEGTTEQSTEDNSTTEENSSGDCPETEDDQYLYVCPTSFRRHPKYCNLFYQCDENEETHEIKVAMFTCPNNTIYDESQMKCVEENKANEQCEGEMAQRRRVKRKYSAPQNDPIVVTENDYSCPSPGYFAFEKDSECSPGFLKCKLTEWKSLRGYVYQCPIGYIYWSVSRRCEPLEKVRDCKRSPVNDWSGRWEIPFEKRNVAWM